MLNGLGEMFAFATFTFRCIGVVTSLVFFKKVIVVILDITTVLKRCFWETVLLLICVIVCLAGLWGCFLYGNHMITKDDWPIVIGGLTLATFGVFCLFYVLGYLLYVMSCMYCMVIMHDHLITSDFK